MQVYTRKDANFCDTTTREWATLFITNWYIDLGHYALNIQDLLMLFSRIFLVKFQIFLHFFCLVNQGRSQYSYNILILDQGRNLLILQIHQIFHAKFFFHTSPLRLGAHKETNEDLWLKTKTYYEIQYMVIYYLWRPYHCLSKSTYWSIKTLFEDKDLLWGPMHGRLIFSRLIPLLIDAYMMVDEDFGWRWRPIMMSNAW